MADHIVRLPRINTPVYKKRKEHVSTPIDCPPRASTSTAFRRQVERVSTPLDCPTRADLELISTRGLPVILEELGGWPVESAALDGLGSTPIDCSPISPSVNHWIDAVQHYRTSASEDDPLPPGRELRDSHGYQGGQDYSSDYMYTATARDAIPSQGSNPYKRRDLPESPCQSPLHRHSTFDFDFLLCSGLNEQTNSIAAYLQLEVNALTKRIDKLERQLAQKTGSRTSSRTWEQCGGNPVSYRNQFYDVVKDTSNGDRACSPASVETFAVDNWI